MDLLLRLSPEDYEIKEFPETGTLLIAHKGIKGKPDYSIEGDGFVIEFKDGFIYTVDVYDPEVAKRVKAKAPLELAPARKG